MATPSSLYFLNASSPIIEQIIFFHDHTLIILIIITTLVGYIIISITKRSFINQTLLEGQDIEIIWTLLPAFTLIFIALPSLQVLYLTDETSNPSITLKTIGHQWYWSYEYSDFSATEFDAYILPYEPSNHFRLLITDNHTVLPISTYTRILISATDVIHSWTIPSLGVKADAIPGRLNQTSFLIKNYGLLFGQCSEICGANHSFIPIVLESTTPKNFINWLKTFSLGDWK